MTALNKQALRQLATDAHELGIIKRYTKGIEANKRFVAIATPLAVLALLDELEAANELNKHLELAIRKAEGCSEALRRKTEAAEKRIAELSASHSKLRDTMATIHNTIRMDGGYTPLAAILNAAKRAHEESAAAAGLGVKGE
ncbi:ead/Ea22-like family protein [Salmonella enterica subsp. enterica]|nr:ead/Ea22-like family protein [Salmonella enterica subsp. enterica serovar Schwarzengrund]ECP4654199.1 ead/Ea22-like family protein [Salmonella enterica subsp. enterica serovar Schwarzengrund]EIP6628068.1 ead/Ea22-like family protein [Salmonella enterica subsp. enterica serovar Schwarzengrund]